MRMSIVVVVVSLMTLGSIAEEGFESFDSFDSFEGEESGFILPADTPTPPPSVPTDTTTSQTLPPWHPISKENRAVRIALKHLDYQREVAGIGVEYLLFDLALTNRLPRQKVILSEGSDHPATWVNQNKEIPTIEAIPPYLIPNLTRHLYLSINHRPLQPLSEISHLLPQPLLSPQSNALTVAPSGQMRGQVAFRVKQGESITQLSLHYYDSKYGTIDLPIIGEMAEGTAGLNTLPTIIDPYRVKSDPIERQISRAVTVLRKAYAQAHPPKTSTPPPPKQVTIPPLDASSEGRESMKRLGDTPALITALKTLQWVPAYYKATASLYSPAGLFTQGWATENAMFYALYDHLQGQRVRFGSYHLTPQGREVLSARAGEVPLRDTIPFIEWEEAGSLHSLVLPFLEPSEAVAEWITQKHYRSSRAKCYTTLTMTLRYRPQSDGSTTQSFGMFGGAMGGSRHRVKSAVILKKRWDLAEVSDTPIDVYFPKTTAYYTDHNGTHQDQTHALPERHIAPEELAITIEMPDGTLDTYTHHFEKGESLSDLFLSIALGTPDIPKATLARMEQKRVDRFAGQSHPTITPLSKLQWINRAKLYKFVTLQHAYERHLAQSLGVVATRHKTPRAILAMVERHPDGRLTSSIDLRRVWGDSYGSTKRCRAFQLMGGILGAEAETQVIPNAPSLEGYWQSHIATFTLLPLTQKSPILAWMRSHHLPSPLITRYQQSDRVWLYPLGDTPPRLWFEIDPDTYHTVLVRADGRYGAMSEEEILQSVMDIASYGFGLFKGVETSIFTVLTYSLRLPDTCGVLKSAQRLANTIACAVSTMQFASGALSSTTIANAGGGAGTLLGCAGQGGASKAVSWATALARGNQSGMTGVSETLGGFANGFGDGIALYFMHAKSKSGCP